MAQNTLPVNGGGMPAPTQGFLNLGDHRMAEPNKRTMPHPDDFISVTLALDFQAKLNPEADDPPPVNFIGSESTLSASDATADYLESVAHAIRERRLFGFMVQQGAENAVGASQWIEKTPEEVLAKTCGDNNQAEQKSSGYGDEEGRG
jgi:hypothetical protein